MKKKSCFLNCFWSLKSIFFLTEIPFTYVPSSYKVYLFLFLYFPGEEAGVRGDLILLSRKRFCIFFLINKILVQVSLWCLKRDLPNKILSQITICLKSIITSQMLLLCVIVIIFVSSLNFKVLQS